MESTPRILRCPPERRLAALELLLSREMDLAGRSEWVQRLLGRGTDAACWEGLWIVEAQGKLLGVGWIEGLGRRVGTMWPPRLTRAAAEGDGPALVENLRRLSRESGQHSIILQLSDASADCALWLSNCGFEPLGDLLDLECDLLRKAVVHPAARPASLPAGAGWLEHAELGPERVGAVVDRSYRGSQDFPELRQPRTGVELVSDFLAKPCGAGGFCRVLATPEGAVEGDAPIFDGRRLVGVVLVGREASSASAEINYMGLVSAARGRKWGKWMVGQARNWARGSGAESMWVSVDARNAAAMAAYHAHGFRLQCRRLVMVSRFEPSPTAASQDAAAPVVAPAG